MITLNDLKGKNICITGEFWVSRKKLNDLIFSKTGKRPINHCNSKTDFILLGHDVLNFPTTKYETAVSLKMCGHSIRFISEETTLELFGGKNEH